MKTNIKQLKKKEAWLYLLRRAKAGMRLSSRWLLIRHSHALDVTAVVLVLLVAVYLVAVLLYLDPPGVTKPPLGQLELAKDVIDRLELWIEVRDAVLSAGFDIPEGIL